ncbi:MAG: putative selenate ABC transporter substrate-binding protein [Candidatus Promineifilaceae bacterium]|nr:putative selenate ABC transporter substrate-binding protein [Candidatus Promineifilaceae bacterium]
MKKAFVVIGMFFILLLAACGAGQSAEEGPFVIGAIPDQDPEMLQREYGKLAEYLSEELGVPVEYKPVTDYAASVSAFRVGDLDMVWFGGLTGVQARLQVPMAEALAQRDIDQEFTSVFIANKDSGIPAVNSVEELNVLAGHTFTFGSESSTSGRLMPQYFLSQAGVTLDSFAGEPGFSGAHDRTIELVESGTFEAGALNSEVWEDRVAAGEVDLDRVLLVFESPTFHDYHWVIRPDVAERYGEDFSQKVADAFLNLDPGNPDQAQILEFFNANQFIPTDNSNYAQIEAVGREIGQIVDQ